MTSRKTVHGQLLGAGEEIQKLVNQYADRVATEVNDIHGEVEFVFNKLENELAFFKYSFLLRRSNTKCEGEFNQRKDEELMAFFERIYSSLGTNE